MQLENLNQVTTEFKDVLNRVTIKVKHTNPDAEVNFTAIGIGRDKREAAIFGLGMFFTVMDGQTEEGEITRGEDAISIINEYSGMEDVEKIISNDLEVNRLFNFYESTEIEYQWDKTENSKPGGYISEMEILEESFE